MHPTEPMNRFNPLNKTLDTILNKEMASIKVSWHAQINLSCLMIVSENIVCEILTKVKRSGMS